MNPTQKQFSLNRAASKKQIPISNHVQIVKRFLLKFYLPLALLIFYGTAFAETESRYFPLWQKEKPNITDLALIYQGGSQRPQWTPDRFAPYVSYRDPRSGKEHWL